MSDKLDTFFDDLDKKEFHTPNQWDFEKHNPDYHAARKYYRPKRYQEIKKTSRKVQFQMCNKVARDILREIAQAKTFNQIKEQKLVENCPSRATFAYWLQTYPMFFNAYYRAREIASELLVEEMLEIADDKSQDVIENQNGEPMLNREHLARSRIRIETRKWLIENWNKKQYGQAPTVLQHNVINYHNYSDKQLDNRLEKLIYEVKQ